MRLHFRILLLSYLLEPFSEGQDDGDPEDEKVAEWRRHFTLTELYITCYTLIQLIIYSIYINGIIIYKYIL